MNGRKGTEGRSLHRSPGEDTNPKKLQLNFGSAKALAALCLPSTIFQLPKRLGWWNGRHVRLRGVCRKACGFKSRPEHYKCFCFSRLRIKLFRYLRCKKTSTCRGKIPPRRFKIPIPFEHV